jgi:NAD(P)-dependent dehydrogenase (short-subunit alcohol dehydrogenase family)
MQVHAMSHATILITGSTDGIGKQAALALAKQGHRVLVHGRDEQRCRRTVEAIQEQGGAEGVSSYRADFSSLTEVRGLAKEVLSRETELSVLVNNAGMYPQRFSKSREGYELTFAVNHLAPFALTLYLLELLGQSSPSRIVNVSSMMHARSLDFDHLLGDQGMSRSQAYASSKLCNILFTFELARRLQGSGITANCLHPGVINTKLLRVVYSGGRSPSEGAKNIVYAATAMELSGVSGEYLLDRKSSRPADIAYDATVRRKLWDLSHKLCKGTLPDLPELPER